MSRLIEELKKEHVVIAESLKKAVIKGITSSEGQQTLHSAKDSLLAHLKKEDEQLYPVLIEAAEDDVDLQHTLKMFASDIDQISTEALVFFNKYSEGKADFEFSKDFGSFFTALSKRIWKEESIIYPKYESLKA